MRLLIVSHTPHVRVGPGAYVGWGATVREIDHLASLFDEVRHIACVHPGEPTKNDRAYLAQNVEVVPVPPAGGQGLANKLDVLRCAPRYWATIRRELATADAVHVRCPATIGLVALLALRVARKPRMRWVKYAGNWKPGADEPTAYRVQRQWLVRNRHRGTVTVNGTWPGAPAHEYAFDNPCLTDDEIASAAEAGRGKSFNAPLRLLFVGRLDESKGAGMTLRVAGQLAREGIDVRLDVVGDSDRREDYIALAASLGLQRRVTFHGWLDRTAINPLYAAAHALVLPTRSEGWAKVLSEAMAHGAVPLATAVSSIPSILAETRAGIALPLDDTGAWVAVLRRWRDDPTEWLRLRDNGLAAAPRFGYTRYLEAVRVMFRRQWNVELAPRTATPAADAPGTQQLAPNVRDLVEPVSGRE